jgi:hypothetical protein
MKKLALLMFFGFLAGALIGKSGKRRAEPPPSAPRTEAEKPLPEPKWTAVRQHSKPDLRLGSILSDIRSHIEDGGYYNDSDLITAAHETTHGINSNVRNSLYDGRRLNAFYCLDGRAAVLLEPNTRIERVASNVPPSLRGSVYKLYLVEQAASGWGDRPLYILDEWVSYTNGSATRKDLKIVKRAETVRYMMEFDIYAMTMLMVVERDETSFNTGDLSTFIRWSIERSMSIYDGELEASEYLRTFRDSSDAESLRAFALAKFGKSWCRKFLGI